MSNSPGEKWCISLSTNGPIPCVTPWVLDLLREHGIKATFFMVGDNVRRNPALAQRVRDEGHSVGNHTMHHLQGFKVRSTHYLRDIAAANELIGSHLFRPPHGLMRWAQAAVIKSHYNIIMYDLVTRDYSRKLTPDRVVDNVRRFTRQRFDYRLSRFFEGLAQLADGTPPRNSVAQRRRL